jgi:hypothetical protein
MQTNTRGLRARCGAALVAGALALAACGGGSDGADDIPATTAAAESDQADAAEPDAVESEETAEEPAPVESAEPEPEPEAEPEEVSSGSYDAGDIEFRTVNLFDEPVDIYAVTNGFREGFEIQLGVQPGEVTDFAPAPTDGGRYLLTTAGAGDPTCVVDCDHHIAEFIARPEEGPTRTVLVYLDEAGDAATFEFWEQPTADREGTGNAMIDADPTSALAAVSAVAILEPDFGYRISSDVAEGCLVDVNDSGLVIGGNQVIPYALDTASEFTLHAFEDGECAEAPVGGPFPFDGLPGERFHVMLFGTPGSLEALVLPMVDGLPDTSVDADPAARDEAIGLMAAEVSSEFGVQEPESTCLATLLVDRIGPDVLVIDGALVDLDSLGDEFNELAGAALVESVDECGIDPSIFGR